MNYIAHDCRNTRNNTCNNRWIDKDLTNAGTKIPTWKYCRECCEKLGIDFDNQKPSDYRTEEQNKKLRKAFEENIQTRNKNIKSE